MEEEEERMEGNLLRNFFFKKVSKTASPQPLFSFNRNRLDPSAPLSRQWGGGATGVGLGSGSNQILKRS